MIEKFILEVKKSYSDFEISSEQESYYKNLILYFTKSDSCEWDLNKGLLITGNVGTGKTLSLNVCKKIFKGFKIVPARHIIREYLIEGVGVVDKYGRLSFPINNFNLPDYTKPINLCIDDLGLEEVNQKFYGNSSNVIADILHDRYETFLTYGMITHATTNLDAGMITKTYGDRVRDRLKQMVNQVTLKGNSKRK